MKKEVKKIISAVISSIMCATVALSLSACGSNDAVAADDVKSFVENVDKDFAWEITETLAYDEEYWDSASGFRTAGSDAEHKAADYLMGVFEDIGLEEVGKEPAAVDKWQFNSSEFTMENEAAGEPVSYASTGTDENGITGEVVYLGHGYESDYEKYYDENNLTGDDRNMNGKIVLIDINQDMEYWIDTHYQEAYYNGAAGLMSYSSQYVDKKGNQRGDKWDDACQMQDLCSRDLKLPCVSISREDGLAILDSIEQIKGVGEVPVATLKVDNEILEDQGVSYNVMGKIKGTGNTGQQILVAGHYDKYFYGVNDDCAAIGLIASMAKAMIDSGYEPVNDIIFIAHGSEEWGQTGIAADWATGSWQMITKAHPEWQGTTLGILNYELPAKEVQDGTLSARVFSTEETFAVQQSFIEESGLVDLLGAEAEIEQTALSQPMSDAICYQFNGVPCYQINGYAGSDGPDLSTYHTKYDDKDEYNSEAMDYAIKLSGALAMYIDQSPAITLDFGLRCDELEAVIEGNEKLYEEAGIDIEAYREALKGFREAGAAYTEKAKSINTQYEEAVSAEEDTSKILQEAVEFNRQGLEAYRYLQDNFLGMGGDGEVYIYHDIIQQNINLIDRLIKNLNAGKIDKFMESAWEINGGLEYNTYSFSTETCEEGLKVAYCDYETDNRLYGKAVGRAETYTATYAVVNEIASEGFAEEIATYERERAKLMEEMAQYLNQEISGMEKMAEMLTVK